MYIKLTIIFACFLLISSCGETEHIGNKLSSPECLSSQSKCVLSTEIGEFKVAFDRAELLTESPFQIYVVPQFPQETYVISAHIEGKDMFMGKIPLFFKESNGELIAETMLGSCSQRIMTWQMWIEITNRNSQKKVTQLIEFKSTRR